MSFDILREWDLESFDPGLEFFPETERTVSAEIVELPVQRSSTTKAEFDTQSDNELAREAAALTQETFSSNDILSSEGNFNFEITEAIEQEWAARSAKHAQTDRDDLERERRGVGKKHERFGVEDRDSSGARATTRQAIDALTDMQQAQAMRANQEIYNDILNDTENAIGAYDEQIAILNATLAQLAAERKAILDTTIMLSDGTYVFEKDDGTLVDQDGNLLSKDQYTEARSRIDDGEAIGDSEDFENNANEYKLTLERRNEYQTQRAAWAELQDEVINNSISSEDAATRREELLASMPPELRTETLLQENRENSAPETKTTVTQSDKGYTVTLSDNQTAIASNESFNFGAIQTDVKLACSFQCAVMDTPEFSESQTQATSENTHNNQNSITSMSFNFG